MYPRDPSNPAGEANTDCIPIALHLEKTSRTQLPKHLHLTLHPALFTAQVARLARRIFTALQVLWQPSGGEGSGFDLHARGLHLDGSDGTEADEVFDQAGEGG